MFDSDTLKVLKYLYKHESETVVNLKALAGYSGKGTYGDQLRALLEENMIRLQDQDKEPDLEGGFIDSKDPPRMAITIKGRAYIEQKRKDTWTFWFPYAITTVIALINIVIAAISLRR